MLYRVLRGCFTLVYRFIFRWEVKGRENIPSSGPLIVCANHFSWWDPPLVGCLIGDRPIRFMAKEELFRIPIFGWILHNLHAFPVKRDSADRKAIKKALDTLAAGGILGLFPEGTRSRTGELLAPQAGVALIALKSGADVLPVAIVGPYRLFEPVHVNIGKPLRFAEYYGRKARASDLAMVAGLIMEEIRRLREEMPK